MSRVMMALGDYRFSLATAAYDNLARTNEYRWASQERLNRRPALQFMGQGSETVSLDGTIYPQFRGGLGQVDQMRDQAGKGEPQLLVDGRGRVWGNFAITRIEEGQSYFLKDGTPRKITFRLELEAYGDDAGAKAYAVPPDIRSQAEEIRAAALSEPALGSSIVWNDPSTAATREYFGMSDADSMIAYDGIEAAGVTGADARAFLGDALGLAARALDVSGAVLPAPVALHARRIAGTTTGLLQTFGALDVAPGAFGSRFTRDPLDGLVYLGETVAASPDPAYTSRGLLSGPAARRLSTFSSGVGSARSTINTRRLR